MTSLEAYPCAYCGFLTAVVKAAAGPWRWPKRGVVVNCKKCAGYVRCPEGNHDWDAGETGSSKDRTCPYHDGSAWDLDDHTHRPDNVPEPGDRCKDCGAEIVWTGPGMHDWQRAG
ncbi:hypothetical protein GCM10009754_04320 [Amycolatopsis minnesotensis]|uniref:Uncharacterized protein n=1 Tax=Amycolatopsis minnesotensis TaxID=337894 RepID=A0ABP5BDW6_9PSEU